MDAYGRGLVRARKRTDGGGRRESGKTAESAEPISDSRIKPESMGQRSQRIKQIRGCRRGEKKGRD